MCDPKRKHKQPRCADQGYDQSGKPEMLYLGPWSQGIKHRSPSGQPDYAPKVFELSRTAGQGIWPIRSAVVAPLGMREMISIFARIAILPSNGWRSAANVIENESEPLLDADLQTVRLSFLSDQRRSKRWP